MGSAGFLDGFLAFSSMSADIHSPTLPPQTVAASFGELLSCILGFASPSFPGCNLT